MVAGQQNSIPNLTISFGSTPATLTYVGLAPGNIGLYQFDINVPEVADGDSSDQHQRRRECRRKQKLYVDCEAIKRIFRRRLLSKLPYHFAGVRP